MTDINTSNLSDNELLDIEGGNPAAACPILTPLGCGIALGIGVIALAVVWAID